MTDKKKDRGQGMRRLLSGINIDLEQPKESVVQQLANTIALVPVEQIEPNPYQPRTEFDEAALRELSESIGLYGLIQPITVRHLPPDRFQLISGERRWRASKLAGLAQVPAYIRLADDQGMLEMALVENIQRQDLNPIEIAISYKRLMTECALTQDQLAERLSKGRPTIANYLRLLKLPPEIQNGLMEGRLTIGHARALITIEDIALQMSLFREVLEKDLSVRQVEELVRRYQNPSQDKPAATAPALPLAHQKVQERLRNRFETKVQVKRDASGKGQIVLHFNNDDDLNRLLDVLDSEED